MSPWFGRRQLPEALVPVLEAFHLAVVPLEEGKDALVGVVPQARYPGRPFPEALEAFVLGMEATERLMPAWRAPAVEELWRACDEGVRKARGRADRLAEGVSGLSFEGLLELVQELLDPLEPFERAEERFNDLRVPR